MNLIANKTFEYEDSNDNSKVDSFDILCNILFSSINTDLLSKDATREPELPLPLTDGSDEQGHLQTLNVLPSSTEPDFTAEELINLINNAISSKLYYEAGVNKDIINSSVVAEKNLSNSLSFIEESREDSTNKENRSPLSEADINLIPNKVNNIQQSSMLPSPNFGQYSNYISEEHQYYADNYYQNNVQFSGNECPSCNFGQSNRYYSPLPQAAGVPFQSYEHNWQYKQSTDTDNNNSKRTSILLKNNVCISWEHVPQSTETVIKNSKSTTTISQTICSNCGTNKSLVWRRDIERKTVCNACGLHSKRNGKPRPPSRWKDTIQKRRRRKPKVQTEKR